MGMEQRYFSAEQTSVSIEAADAFSPQHSLTDAEETEANAPTEQATSAEATTLAALLQQEARNRRKEEGTTMAWASAFLILMAWLASRPFTDAPAFMTNFILCFVLLGGLGLGMCVQLCRCSYRRKRSLTSALAQTHDVKQAGPLIQTLRVPHTPVRNLAKQALIGLLPTLQASDAALLGDSERALLLRQLSIPPNDLGYRDLTELFSRSAFRRELALRVSILKALEQVGGTKELGAVERLSRGLPTLHLPLHGASRIHPEIQEAARECLPYLQVRANAQRASEQLLRASSVHALPDNGLLRPASTRADTLPEQLLRASEPRL